MCDAVAAVDMDTKLGQVSCFVCFRFMVIKNGLSVEL